MDAERGRLWRATNQGKDRGPERPTDVWGADGLIDFCPNGDNQP